MTFTNKDMILTNKDLTAGRTDNKDLTDDLTLTRIATERMVTGTTDGTDDDSEGYAVVTKKRKNRSSPTADARKTKTDKVETSRFRLDLGTDEDTDDSDEEESATRGMTAVKSSINMILGKGPG
ncbi:hypothetical protein J6590_103960 [Homalodisca vitripennis]|nr:hypothetical protein J6590_103960 [Homalodisca vitripennis]